MLRAHAPLTCALLLTLLIVGGSRPAAAGTGRFTPYGPWNTRIVDSAVDPSAPRSLLAITDFYGLYRSDDGGATWAWSGAGIDLDTQQGVAADPANPGSFYLITSSAAFHSANGGRSWTRVASGLHFQTAVLPHQRTLPGFRVLPAGRGAPPTLLVSTIQNLFRSGDGGVTWSTVYDSQGFLALNWGLATDPGDPRRVWLTPPSSTPGQLFTSTDGGQTFTPVPNTPESLLVTLVVPASPTSLVFAIGLNDLWKSTDSGATWRKIPQTVVPMAYETATPSIVYGTAGTAGNAFYWSSDAGETWTRRGAGLPALGIDKIRTAPGTRTLYATSDLDFLRSEDRGRHWSLVAESGVGIGFPTRLRFRPGAPQTVFAVRGGEGYRSANGGATWASFGNLVLALETPAAPIRDLVIDPANPDHLHVATDHGVFDSVDGGAGWTALSPQLFGSLAFAGPSGSRRRGLVGAGCALSRSRDGGRSWSVALACPTGDPTVSRRIDRLVVDPRNPDLVYAGGIDISNQGFIPRIWKSADAGASWQRIVGDSEVLGVDPSRSGRLYVTRPAGLFRSDDAGRTLERISGFAAVGSGLQPAALLVDPATPSTLYAATFGQGIWRSNDSGVTWAPENAGLTRYGNLVVEDLVLDPAVPHRLYALADGGMQVNQLTQP